MLIKTGYPNLLQGCVFLCLPCNLMNYTCTIIPCAVLLGKTIQEEVTKGRSTLTIHVVISLLHMS